MPMDVIGAVDQGTTSTRFYLYDVHGQPVQMHQVEFQQVKPKAGWYEHDPEVLYATVLQCITKCLASCAAAGQHVVVKALGITNQRETTLAWDAITGTPLHNAIVWMDARTSHTCQVFKDRYGGKDFLREVTGLPVSTYFSAYKMRWMMDHVPAVATAAAEGRCRFGTVDTWLMYKLTGGSNGGVFVTDVTNASRTSLMDINSFQWHEPTCSLFGIPIQCLPAIKSNAEIYGHIAEGPLAGTPIAGSLGDQQAALLGQRCGPGAAKNTYGTGCFLLLNTGHKPVSSVHGLLTTVAFQLGPSATPYYALEGSIAFAGGGVGWLRDQLQIINTAAESEELASSVPDTAGCYFVPAFGGLLAPHWRDDARGVIMGLTAYTGKAHIARALLEAIAFQSRDVLDAMRQDADLTDLRVLRVDGGASHNNLLLQIQTDLLQVPVERPAHLETTSLGAALAAGIAIRFYSAEKLFCGGLPDNVQQFVPCISEDQAERRHRCWRKALQRSLDLADLHGLDSD